MIVVDTSAVIGALAGRPDVPGLARRLAEDGDLHAPHLLDVEMIHALRRLVEAGDLTTDRAADVRSDFADLAINSVPAPATGGSDVGAAARRHRLRCGVPCAGRGARGSAHHV